MFQYNMPLRALAKMTSGAISMGMVDGIVLEAKGFWVIGLVKVILEAISMVIFFFVSKIIFPESGGLFQPLCWSNPPFFCRAATQRWKQAKNKIR